MKLKVLLNPYANRWNARKRWPEAEAALKTAGLDYSLAVSENADQLTPLAAQAVKDGFEAVIVAGGDGSVGEVINGLARGWNEDGKLPAMLGILPMGSANDFAFAIGLPLELAEAAKVIARCQARPVDLCKCNERYFINNSGVALEPYVTTKHERIHWIKGITRYLVAALWAIMDRPEWHGRIQWDDGEYVGPISLGSVGNGRRTGGFFMTPHADPFDGKLTVAFGHRSTRWGLLTALPHAFKQDRDSYVYLPGMRELDCTEVRFHLDKPSPAHTDGVLFDRWLTELEYRIFPAAVPVLM